MSFDQRALNCAIRASYWSVIYWRTYEVPDQELWNYTRAQLEAAKPFYEWLEAVPQWETAMKLLRVRTMRESQVDKLHDALRALTDAAYVRRHAILSSPTVKPSAVRIIRALFTFNRTESAASMNRIFQATSALGSPVINRAMTLPLDESWTGKLEAPAASIANGDGQKIDEIKESVKRLGGTRFLEYLTRNEVEEIKKSGDPQRQVLLQDYLSLSKNAEKVFKDQLARVIGESGELTMDCKAVTDAMVDFGITRTPIPRGFVGRIDAEGRLYTAAGDRLAMNPGAPNVTMNPKYTGKDRAAYCFGAWPDAVRASTGKLQLTSYQTEKQTQMRVEGKNVKIEKGLKNIEKIRTGWQRLMMSKVAKERALGCALQFMYQCSLRVGSEMSMSKGTSTFGATTFEMRHVLKVTKTMIHIRFPTKSDGIQDLVLRKGKDAEGDGKLKFENLLFKLMVEDYTSEAKKEQDPKATAWTYPGGWVKNKDINRWLKRYGDFSSQMFRALNGSLQMEKLLQADIPEPPTQKGKEERQYAREFEAYTKKVVAHYMECATEVGKTLGHFRRNVPDPMNAIGSFIGSNITIAYFEQAGVPIPAKVAYAIKQSSKEME